MIDIRALTEADLTDVLSMIHALAAHHGDPIVTTLSDLRRDALGPHPWLRVLVAPGEGYVALCPLAQLQHGVRGMDIHHLFVRQSSRGRGVGRALVQAARKRAETEGCRYLTVGTHPDNVAAQAIYAGMGFDQLPTSGPRFRVKW